MTNRSLALLVCSNRKGINFSNIWRNVMHDKHLNKVVLVTQGKANSYNNEESKVIHIKLDNKGRSRAINRGLKEIHTDFVGLTDDDCFLDKNWVSQAVKTLKKSGCAIAFGQTFPYQPEKHKGMICPCTFTKNPNKYSITARLVRHWEEVGFDNNAVVKKSLFDEIGGYKWWLGPGSIGKNAEDAEFILRSLITKHKIAYNPSMIVHHNKWLTQSEWKEALQIYLCGGVAAYGFYSLQGVKECHEVVRLYTFEALQNIVDEVRQFLHKKVSLLNLIKTAYTNFAYLSRGLTIVFLFAKIIPIPKKEKIGKPIK